MKYHGNMSCFSLQNVAKQNVLKWFLNTNFNIFSAAKQFHIKLQLSKKLRTNTIFLFPLS